MTDEPIRLPDYGAAIQALRWYCYHCDNFRTTADSMHTHLSAQHDIAHGSRGVDFGQGGEVAIAKLRHQLWQREQPGKFARLLDSLRGADDFAFEVGQGASIEKWDSRPKDGVG